MKIIKEKIAQELKYKSMLTFIFIFYLTMGISQYSQILFFQQNNGLTNYAVSYSAMAVAGAFSFLLSNHFASWGLRRTSLVFLPIYAIGMFLRVIPNSFFIALISGIFSGIGASVVLLIIRSWIYSVSDSDSDSKGTLVSARYTIMQVSSLLATVIAGGIISLFNSNDAIYMVLLIISSILMGSLTIVKAIPNGRIQRKKNNLFTALPQNKTSGLILFSVVAFLGLTNALIDPILPAILRDNGLEVSLTSIWVTIFGLLTVGASLFFQHSRLSKDSGKAFLLNELIVGIFMLISGVFYKDSFNLLLIAFSLMSISTAGFFIFKELMEYDMFPKKESFIYLGLAQSGFLVGDALGSPIGTFIFQQYGTQMLLFMYGIFSISCGFSYYAFYKVSRNKLITLYN